MCVGTERADNGPIDNETDLFLEKLFNLSLD